ncbi:biotin/lipoate A/B protein ligase family protein [Haloparvum alkalitolerans]|uniref:lipoate--protein ligase family protein n=1 Tax=Haloparvum alkalitolerans TaxID=1042953 RepID=UPI003CEC452B
MRVVRGRAGTPDDDREATAAMLSATAADGIPRVRVRAPHRQVAFGRRDARQEGFPTARAAALERGYEPVERSVGGRAVAYTGETLAFAVAVPLAEMREGLDERYATATETLLETLRDLGADVARGEPAASFCPGDHSVRVADGGKVAGLAQRVQKDAALVSGCLVVVASDEPAVAEVLTPVYDALGVTFDPESVGSLAAAGGPSDPDRVARALETAFAAGPWGGGTPAVVTGVDALTEK